MAVGDENIGFGGIIEVDDGPAGAFQTIPNCEVTGVPSKVIGTVESKRLDLPNRVIKKIRTLANGGSFTFRTQFTHATWARLKAIRDDFDTEPRWRVTVPDDDGDTIFTVPGILTEAKTDDLEPEKITTISCTVEVSGDDV